ncbi:MAG TPA: glycosyltransferase, partial [Clostridiaceae bacterium]
KYKVYLRPNSLIIDTEFISNILFIFNKYPKVGILGAIGSESIPTSGQWWHSSHRCGGVYTGISGNMVKLSFNECKGISEEGLTYYNVALIDAAIFTTQYDLNFDIKEASMEYLSSFMSIEYKKAGYDLLVFEKSRPYILFNKNINIEDNLIGERKTFPDKYLAYIPRVTIIIPIYCEGDFLITLDSIIAQGYKSLDVVILDTTKNMKIMDLIENIEGLDIKYYSCSLEEFTYNCDELIKNSKGDLFTFIYPGDILHSSFLEILVNYFIDYEDINIAFSSSKSSGFLYGLFDSTVVIEGKKLYKLILRNNLDLSLFISGVLFRKKTKNSGAYLNLYYTTLCLEMMESGNVVYVASSLVDNKYIPSYTNFINIEDLHKEFTLALEWFNLIEEAHLQKKLDPEAEYYKALVCYLIKHINLIKWMYNSAVINSMSIKEMKDALIKVVATLKVCDNDSYINLAEMVEKIL